MALSQGQMRVIGVVLTIALLGGAVAIVYQQMKSPAKTLVVDTGQPAPPNSPDAAPPTKGKPVSGVVVNSESAPMSGVEVVLVPEGFGFDPNGPRPPNYATARTDAQGKFEFAQPNAWWDLVAINDAGYAQFAREEVPADGKIIHRPWGRVEGTFLIGKTPQPNQLLSLYPMSSGRALATTNPASPYRMVSSGGHMRLTQRTSTDAQGHFLFERVPPGSMMISRIVTIGRTARSNNLATAEVRAGQTTTANIGGKGRPVIGRVALDRK